MIFGPCAFRDKKIISILKYRNNMFLNVLKIIFKFFELKSKIDMVLTHHAKHSDTVRSHL